MVQTASSRPLSGCTRRRSCCDRDLGLPGIHGHGCSGDEHADVHQRVGGVYPELSGAPFNVRALECDRVATVHATGKMSFTDLTTGKSLGSASLRSGTPFANCSQALITDREKLRQGDYRIKAVYTPSGRTPVHKSSGSYLEIIQ